MTTPPGSPINAIPISFHLPTSSLNGMDNLVPDDDLMFVEVELNNYGCLLAMVDTGSTHTLISEYVSEAIGLKLAECTGSMRGLNQEAESVKGLALEVDIKMHNWRGKVDLMVARLDHFQVILGMDFLKANKVVVMPHLEGIMVQDSENPCFIPDVRNGWC